MSQPVQRSHCGNTRAGTPRSLPSLLKLIRFGCQGCGRSWTSGERRCMRTTSRSRGAWICGFPSRRFQIRSQSSSPVGMIVNWGRSMIAPGP